MSKKAFEKIEEGLIEVLAIVRGEAKPFTKEPTEVISASAEPPQMPKSGESEGM